MTSGYHGYSVYCPQTNPQSSYSDALSPQPEDWYTSHIVARQTDEIKTKAVIYNFPSRMYIKKIVTSNSKTRMITKSKKLFLASTVSKISTVGSTH